MGDGVGVLKTGNVSLVDFNVTIIRNNCVTWSLAPRGITMGLFCSSSFSRTGYELSSSPT
jgi:hypothetical protein